MRYAELVIRLNQRTMVRLWEVARRYGLTPQEYVLGLILDALDVEAMVERMGPEADQMLMMIMPALLQDD